MTRKIAVVGSKGMLGTAFMRRVLPDTQLVGVDLPDIDITNSESISNFIRTEKPNVIINCAAYTAVDKCETEQQIAFRVNEEGPANLAGACAAAGIELVHFSTDYVFNGEKGEAYSEDDPPSPESVYGNSKLQGELRIKDGCDRYYIVRTAWLYGEFGNNFVKTMLKLAEDKSSLTVVNDQFGSPTYTEDLVDAVFALLAKGRYGVYHITGQGVCSWYEFAREIFRIMNKNVMITPCSTTEFPRPAKRPRFGVLSGEKLQQLDIYTRRWELALKDYLLKPKVF